MRKNEFSITDAGEKYLELYAEPGVTNIYLKLALLVLSVVALALLALFYRSETAALRLNRLRKNPCFPTRFTFAAEFFAF